MKISRRRVDPNQLSLLDYAPPVKPILSAAPAPKPSAAHKGAKSQPFTRAGLLTAAQAAQYLNLSVWTLKDWRKKKYGPPHIKLGIRLVAYRPADLDAYIASKVR